VNQRLFGPLLASLTLCVLAINPVATAQAVPVVLLAGSSTNLQELAPALNRVAASIGASAWTGPSLGEAIRSRFGRAAPTLNTLAGARVRIDAARAAYATAVEANDSAAMNSALDQLEQIASELESQPDLLATFADAREQHARALLFVANTTIAHTPQRADDAIRRMVTMDALQVLPARVASTAVRAAFSQQVAALATAGLVVQSVAPGCDVFRDGRSVGRAPAQLSNLTPGSHHRISVQCAGQHSLLHPVLVAQGSTSTVSIDIQLDQALEAGELSALRYSSPEVAAARWVRDLSAIGTALGSARVFGVAPSQDKVVVVDVVTASLAGEAPITDGALLRRLANGATVISSANQQTNIAVHANTTDRTSSPHSPPLDASNDAQSNTVRPPQVGVGGSAQAATSSSRAPQLVTTRVTRGYPVTTALLATTGAGAIAGGMVLSMLSANALNRAEQSATSEAGALRPGLLSQSQLQSTLSLVSYSVGGALLLTATLVGIFARDTQLVQTTNPVLAIAASPDGLAVTVRGAL
jgi:hypothetical protein